MLQQHSKIVKQKHLFYKIKLTASKCPFYETN